MCIVQNLQKPPNNPSHLRGLPTQGYPVELGFEHRTNSGVVSFTHHTASLRLMTDPDDLLGPLPEGPVTRGLAATLLKTGRCPRSADTSSEDPATTEIGAGEHGFLSSGSGWGHRRTVPSWAMLPRSAPRTSLSQLRPPEAILSPPALLPAQLPAPAAPGPRAVGPPPFGAACHPARPPAGADPQGL